MVQTVFYTVLAFPQLQFITVVDDAFALCSLSLSAGPCSQESCTAWTIPGSAVLGQVVLARRCATPGTVFVRAVRSVARGDTTGAVLGRGLGHYDKCRGLDSAQLQVIFKIVDFLFLALRQFPVVLVRFPSCFFHGGRCPCCADATGCSLPVVIPQVRLLDKFVKPVWWRLHRSTSWTR